MSQREPGETAWKASSPHRLGGGAALVAIVPLVAAGMLLAVGCGKSPGGQPENQVAAAGQQASAARPGSTANDEAVPPGPPPGKGGAPDAEPRGAGRGMAEHPDELKLPPARGRVLHVSSKALPGGDGSGERPWNDLQLALRQLRKGDRLVLLPGDYVGPFEVGEGCAEGTTQEPIEVVGRVNAILRSANQAPALTVRRSGWSFAGLDVVPGGAARAAIEVAGARDLLFFRCHLHGGGGDGMVVGPGSESVTIAQVHIHGFGVVSGPPKLRSEVNGLEIAPGTRAITTKGCKIQNIGGPPVKIITPAEYGPGPGGKPYPPAAKVDLGDLTTITNWPETTPT